MLMRSWLEGLLRRISVRTVRRRRGAVRRSYAVVSAMVERLEERVMLSSSPLDGGEAALGTTGTISLTSWEEVAPGAFIQHTVVDTTLDVASASSSPVVGDLELNGNGLQFNFIAAPGMSQAAIDGFQAAADLWSSILTDDIIVNIEIDFRTLGAGILGSASSDRTTVTYASFRTGLVNDATSASDATAVASLQSTAAASMLLNRTANSPNGSGSATPYLDNDGDANNTTIQLTRANAKAAGLIAAGSTSRDASIAFSDAFTWDFNRGNGISAGAFDFVGVAAHEIGHALGFVSGVDILDLNGTPPNVFNDNQFTFVAPMDLFRFSTTSFAQGTGIFDWTADNRTKYFSIDGGATQLATFSTGRTFGDGQQASHWKDSLGIGIMDPTAAPGEYADITNLDVRGFDVIGWNVVMDFGDAPDTGTGTGTGNYQSNLSDNGPRHILFSASGSISDPGGAPKVFLGTGVTAEPSALQQATATGDVDDGVVSIPVLIPGTTVDVTVTSTGGGAILNYFVDFNRDGDFSDSGEAFTTTLTSTSQTVSIVVPVSATLGNTAARFRISTAGGLAAVGPANDGEVEDYWVAVATNSTPPVAQPSSVTTNEDTARTFSVSDFQFTDNEGNPLASITVSNLALAIGDTLRVNQGAGLVAVTNGMTITAAQIPTLTYAPASNANGAARSTFDFTVNDAEAGVVSATMTINVTAVNDAPVRTTGSLTAISVDEDSTNIAAVSLGLAGLTYAPGPATATDEAGQTLTYTITAIPAFVNLFLADGSTQVAAGGTVTAAELVGLKFKTLADASGSGNVVLTIRDSGSGVTPNVRTLVETLSITVNAVNDAPVRTAGSLTPITVDEDSANNTAVSLGLAGLAYAPGPATATDEGGQMLTYTITTIPAFVNIFLADGTTQVTAGGTVTAAELVGLTYKTLADANGIGDLVLTVRDSGGSTAPHVNALVETQTITVNPINDAPVRTAGSLTPVTVDEDSANSTAITLGLSGLAYAPGPASAGDESGQTLTYSITAIPSFVAIFLADGSTEVLLGATVSAAELVDLTFKTLPDAFGVGDLELTISDDGGGAAPHADTLVETLSITVRPVNDAPVATDDANGTDENTVLLGNAITDGTPDSDVDDLTDVLLVSQVNGDALNVGVQLVLASGALLVVNPDGTYTYNPNRKFEHLNVGESAVETFTYVVVDPQTAESNTATVTITIHAADDGFTYSGNNLALRGTNDDDVILYQTAARRVIFNGVAHILPVGITFVSIDGREGHDRLTIFGTSDYNTAVFRPGRVFFEHIADHAGFDAVSLNMETNIVFGGGGNDSAVMHDTAGVDKLFSRPTGTVLVGAGLDSQVLGFGSVTAISTAGNDVAKLFDSNGDETFIARPTIATLIGTSFTNSAQGFETVFAFAAGGDDLASLTGTAGLDAFRGFVGGAVMSGAGYNLQLSEFDVVNADGRGGTDRAVFIGSAGRESLSTTPTSVQFVAGGSQYNTSSFEQIIADAGIGPGDVAVLSDSVGNDTFTGDGNSGEIAGVGYFVKVTGFDIVRIRGLEGGTNQITITSPLNYILQELGTWI